MHARRELPVIAVLITHLVLPEPTNMGQIRRTGPGTPRIQEELLLEDPMVVVEFGKAIIFKAHIRNVSSIRQVSILLKGIHEEIPRETVVQIPRDGWLDFTYDASRHALPPFGTLLLWVQATLEDGRTVISAPIAFEYDDNRFPWQLTGRGDLNVHWIAGEDSFGAQALEAADSGLLSIRELLPISLIDPLDIYIYSNPQDLQDALALGGMDWTAGHAPPQVGVVLVAIEPGPNQAPEMGTEIPHELAHLMLYRILADGYARQPAWLLEGIAAAAERQPNPDYLPALQAAEREGSLLSFRDLCTSLPTDAANAFLAHAQSQSMVNYIRSTYGNSDLLRLTDTYADGTTLDATGCELGTTIALGTPLSQLEQSWHEAVFQEDRSGTAARNLTPFVMIMALVLIIPLWGVLEMTRQRRKRGTPPK